MGEVGEHIAVAEERSECLESQRHIASRFHGFGIGCGCRLIPMPGILKRLNLSGRWSTFPSPEENVVVLIRVKRRIEVYKIHRRRGDMPSEHVQVVPVIELVDGHRTPGLSRLDRRVGVHLG
jgi:hypothetical protein